MPTNDNESRKLSNEEIQQLLGSERATLQKQLQEYHAAIQSEFATEGTARKLTAAENEQFVRERLLENAPKAVIAVVHLAEFATSETVRLSAAKFIIQHALVTEGSEEEDPFRTLLADLMQKSPSNADG